MAGYYSGPSLERKYKISSPLVTWRRRSRRKRSQRPTIASLDEREGDTSCPFCHDMIEEGERVYTCSGCGIRVHRECLSELEQCPTLGCGPMCQKVMGKPEQPRRVPAGQRWLRRARRGSARDVQRTGLAFLTVTALVFGLLVFATGTPLRGPLPYYVGYAILPIAISLGAVGAWHFGVE